MHIIKCVLIQYSVVHVIFALSECKQSISTVLSDIFQGGALSLLVLIAHLGHGSHVCVGCINEATLENLHGKCNGFLST